MCPTWLTQSAFNLTHSLALTLFSFSRKGFENKHKVEGKGKAAALRTKEGQQRAQI